MADECKARILEPGDRFGDYTVEKLLGKGGMGAVYLMRGASGSEYAVKIMFPDKVTHDLRRRFAKEAEFAIKIRHRNLVSVYDVGEDPETGLCYMIMDYVAGGSLSDMLKRRGRLPIGEAVSIASQVAAALEVAHRHGLVHRDIKPDNILFDADGTPRLADLGVAKFDESQQSMVTTTGMVIGTPAYMAPEQMLNSHAIDARADIYSLGVVLYEMLSGKRPNEGRTAIELMAKAIKGDPLPDIKTLCPELSAAVAHVVSLLCAPKPEARPQTALAAADILRKAASGKFVLLRKKPQSSAADAAARKKRIPVGAIVSALGIVALCATVVANYLNKPKPRLPPAQKQVIVVTNVVERVAVVTNAVERTVVHAVPEKESLWDEDSTKAAQKALDALFPGWKTSENESRKSRPKGAGPVGFVRSFRGRNNLVCTMPFYEKSFRPVSIRWEGMLDAPDAKLEITVCNQSGRIGTESDRKGAGFLLQVFANETAVHEEKITDGRWHDMSIDLAKYAGKRVTLEIRQTLLPFDPWGRAYWARIAVTGKGDR